SALAPPARTALLKPRNKAVEAATLRLTAVSLCTAEAAASSLVGNPTKRSDKVAMAVVDSSVPILRLDITRGKFANISDRATAPPRLPMIAVATDNEAASLATPP